MMLLASVDGGHSGIVHPRSAPELSDVALFVVAVIGVWLVRRGLRARFSRQRKD